MNVMPLMKLPNTSFARKLYSCIMSMTTAYPSPVYAARDVSFFYLFSILSLHFLMYVLTEEQEKLKMPNIQLKLS